MQELAITVSAYGSFDELTSHIRGALDRKLPELTAALCSHDGTFVIVGSGPSLPLMLDEIRAEREKGRPICALNGAHDFLIENGVVPDLFLSVDPRDTIVKNTSKKNQDVIYLLASCCAPELFDHLSDHKVMLWHAWSTGEECKAFLGHFGIGGGTTSGTRALYVAYVMGYRKFVCFGLDSCLAEDGITKRFSGEKAGAIVDVVVGESGRKFLCNHAMAQQATEVQQVLATLSGITIDFRGDGLLTAIWAERKRLGLPT